MWLVATGLAQLFGKLRNILYTLRQKHILVHMLPKPAQKHILFTS